MLVYEAVLKLLEMPQDAELVRDGVEGEGGLDLYEVDEVHLIDNDKVFIG